LEKKNEAACHNDHAERARVFDKFMTRLNEEIFVKARLYYKRKDHMTGEVVWEDRGDIVLNAAHIGKVQVYFEYGKEQ